MNPWEVFVNAFSWFFVVGMLVILLAVLSAVLIGVLKGARNWFKPRPKESPVALYQSFKEDATIAGLEKYQRSNDREALIEAFREGAYWAWDRKHQ